MGKVITELADGACQFTSTTDFHCEGGGIINPLQLTFETYGTLNAARDNAIVVHHALSTDSHLAATAKKPATGWWENMIGPGHYLDTNRHCIICINNLGSCFGSSGPASINPNTSRTYRSDFPAVTIMDMVQSQKLLIDALGIRQLHAIVGNSMGAMLSIAWLTRYPQHAKNLISISSAAQAYPANNANRHLQGDMIRLDPAWRGGNYLSSGELEGFKAARRLGLLTYRNWAELNERFLNKSGKESIDHYLAYNAEKFVKRFDCNSYLYLLDAMNQFNLGSHGNQLVEVFRPIQARALVVSVDSDILFTPSQQIALYEALIEAGVDATLIEHHSTYGHDAFLVETEDFGGYIQHFISDQQPDS